MPLTTWFSTFLPSSRALAEAVGHLSGYPFLTARHRGKSSGLFILNLGFCALHIQGYDALLGDLASLPLVPPYHPYGDG